MLDYKTDYNEWAEYYDVIYKIIPPEDFKIYKKFVKESSNIFDDFTETLTAAFPGSHQPLFSELFSN